MNSRHGTFINGVRLRAFTMVVLFPGMQVHVGNPKEKNSFTVHFLKEKWKEELSRERRRSSVTARGSMAILKRPSKDGVTKPLLAPMLPLKA